MKRGPKIKLVKPAVGLAGHGWCHVREPGCRDGWMLAKRVPIGPGPLGAGVEVYIESGGAALWVGIPRQQRMGRFLIETADQACFDVLTGAQWETVKSKYEEWSNSKAFVASSTISNEL